MSREILVRIAALYVPIVAAAAGWLLFTCNTKKWMRQRLGATVLVQTLWVLPVLWMLQLMNTRTGWWSFHTAGPAVRGMPVEMYLGWTVLWGAVPSLLLGQLPLRWRILLLIGFDLLAMPYCAPVLSLSPTWLWGEALFVLIGLVPALLLGEWTVTERHPLRRAWMQVVMAGMVVLLLLPECVFVIRSGGWNALPTTDSRLAHAILSVEIQAILLLGVIGVAAAREFGERGEGTPIPFDPPRRLVTSGIYRYVANPMQLSCALVMLAWAAMLHSLWLALGAICGILYSAGLATWDEAEDLRTRFGLPWLQYRAEVHNWLPRWKPYLTPGGQPATLWISGECGPCNEVRRWFTRHEARGLVIMPAEAHPTRRLRRIRYEDGGYGVDGVRAVFRAVEHLHFGWAFAGMVLSMPGMWWLIQAVLDSCGLGPRSFRRGTIPIPCIFRLTQETRNRTVTH
ncbi:isoprenylcysteine carboxylmethyltransferase family protein [Terriglobus sp. 2YAB30_2]|uniref:methyltransferase family protein n=1 Tax=unclassified Terriglobus TaxID=2628988 RepID=UPI003F9D174C